MRRSNHYEAAFEGFIRSIRVPCVAIDEAKRAICGDDDLKNPDFLLYPQFGSNLVVEVKGKRAQERAGPAQLGELGHDGRSRWSGALAGDVRAGISRGPGVCLCRADRRVPVAAQNGAYEFRGLEYRFWAVGLDDYVAHLRSRGPAWKAVAMARRAFRRRVQPSTRMAADELRLESSSHSGQGAHR